MNDFEEYLKSSGIYDIACNDFLESQKNVVAEIRNAIKNNELKNAYFLSHTLKGLAGLISENSIVCLAETAEAAFRDGTVPTAECIDELSKEMERVLAAIASRYKDSPKLEMTVQDKPNRSRALIIDDMAMILNILGNILSDDYDVRKVRSGEKGLAYAKRSIPDIILLDVLMPYMDGLDVLEALKADEATKNIPVILLTGDEDSREKGRLLGAADFIGKPFNADDVKDRVKRAFEGRLSQEVK